MRILITSHSFYPNWGGIEIDTDLKAEYLSMLGHTVIVVTQTKSTRELTKNSKYLVIRCPSIANLLSLYKWADLIIQNNIEIRSLWPIIFFKKRLSITLHTWIKRPKERGSYKSWVKHMFLKRATSVFAVSQAIAKHIEHKNIIISKNPIRSNIFREIFEIERNKHFIYVGRLVSDKGVDILVKAFSRLMKDEEILAKTASTDDHFKLTIVGSGDAQHELEGLTRELEIQQLVEFKGSLRAEELTQILNQHKYLVVPSRWEEPFGNVVIEALACGCIPIAANIGGLPEAVGNTGYLFTPNNIDSLYVILKKIVLKKDLKPISSEIVEEHLKQHFQITACKNYYQALLS